MKKIAIVAFDKFTDVDVFLPWDLFNRTKFRATEVEVKLVGTKPTHKSVCGLNIEMGAEIEYCNAADIVFFASGPGTRSLIKDVEYLKRFNLNPKRQVICSMCSGALILASLGLLNGLSATTYPTAFEELRNMGVEVIEDSHLVTHGNIGTAAGCLAIVDLVGWALEKVFGAQVKDDVIASVLPIGQGQVCIY